MGRNNNKHQTLCIEELVKQRPIRTEAELNDFYSYEEAVQECMQLFDEGVKQINQEYALYTGKKEQ